MAEYFALDDDFDTILEIIEENERLYDEFIEEAYEDVSTNNFTDFLKHKQLPLSLVFNMVLKI